MPSERKTGLLKLEGANPMVLVPAEHSAPAEAWPEETEAIARAVSQSIKRYVQVTESLAVGRYAHLRNKIPSYLSNPGNILMVICTDGVVVRYETKGNDESKKAVTVMPQSIANVAALLSQNLVHIATPESPHPSLDTFGVALKLNAVSPTEGLSQDLIVTRIWFQAAFGLPQEPKQIGAKPYCLLSVQNHLELELHGTIGPDAGEVDTGRPFISRSELRLLAGWDCIEVFPTLALDEWNPDFAPLWAERDILGAALVTQTKDVQLSNLDPRASARRQYAMILGAFKSLLDSEPDCVFRPKPATDSDASRPPIPTERGH